MKTKGFKRKIKRKRTKKIKRKKKNKRTKKNNRISIKPKGLTKLGIEWVKYASKDIKEREILYLKNGDKRSKKE